MTGRLLSMLATTDGILGGHRPSADRSDVVHAVTTLLRSQPAGHGPWPGMYDLVFARWARKNQTRGAKNFLNGASGQSHQVNP